MTSRNDTIEQFGCKRCHSCGGRTQQTHLHGDDWCETCQRIQRPWQHGWAFDTGTTLQERMTCDEAAEALAAPTPSPGGESVVVPREPTEAMLKAARFEASTTTALSVWRSMLAAAPASPPISEGATMECPDCHGFGIREGLGADYPCSRCSATGQLVPTPTVKGEREACAKICDDWYRQRVAHITDQAEYTLANRLSFAFASAIRARTTPEGST